MANKDHITEQATKWFVQLNSGNAKETDFERCQSWREAAPDNETAWQKVEQLTSQFKGFSSEKGLTKTLRRLYEEPQSASRRNILKQMAVLMTVGTSSYFVYKKQPWQELTADYSTGTGEYREIALVDGTRLFMNTATAVDIEFNETQRRLVLLKGEVLIETAHEKDGPYRPFILKTQHGEVTALGTRFSVRDRSEFSSVSLFEGKVKVQPKYDQHALTLNAGESLNFNALAMLEKGVADPAAVSWAQGFIIVDQMPLGELITELSRYRKGLLQCDTRIAHLRVSGSFPTNTEESLNILARKFPIRVETFTRYWIKLIPV